MTADFFIESDKQEIFLSFIISKVFELQSCATVLIVDHFKSFKKSNYFLKFLMTQIVDMTLKRKVLPFL